MYPAPPVTITVPLSCDMSMSQLCCTSRTAPSDSSLLPYTVACRESSGHETRVHGGTSVMLTRQSPPVLTDSSTKTVVPVVSDNILLLPPQWAYTHCTTVSVSSLFR